MADLSRDSAATDASPYEPTNGARATSGWAGWVVFAGVLLLTLGAFHVIEGVVALFRDTAYFVTASRLLVSVDYTTWGWVHLILGIVAVLTGLGLLAGNTAARVVGIGLAALSAIVNLAFAKANPWWSVILITLAVIVIYAIAVHGRELKSQQD